MLKTIKQKINKLHTVSTDAITQISEQYQTISNKLKSDLKGLSTDISSDISNIRSKIKEYETKIADCNMEIENYQDNLKEIQSLSTRIRKNIIDDERD